MTNKFRSGAITSPPLDICKPSEVAAASTVVAGSSNAPYVHGLSSIHDATNSSREQPRRSGLAVRFKRVGDLKYAHVQDVVEGVIPSDALVSVVGASGSGKTFFALDVGCHIAANKDYHERRTKGGLVCYLAGEGLRRIPKRVDAWRKHHGVAEGDLNLYVADRLPFLVGPYGAQAIVDGIQDVIVSCEAARGAAPQLVIIDTVARAMTGADENSALDMNSFIMALDDIRMHWGTTVMSLHHTGHNAGGRPRGSSVFTASHEVEILVETKKGKVVATSRKAKDGALFDPLCFETRSVPLAYTCEEGKDTLETSLVLISSAVSVADEARPNDQVAEKVRDLLASGVSRREIQRRLEAAGVKVSREKIGKICASRGDVHG